MNMVCGIYERMAPCASGIGAMLAELPGGRPANRWLGGPVAMARRGLAANAANPGAPSLHRRAGLAIAADVRLDNRSEVARALGVSASAGTVLEDAELALRAYQRWGSGCPDRLVGDFAFAIWDASARRLFCARDAVGARPFYYAASPERFVFASDVAAVLAAPGVDDGLDEDYAAAYLARRLPGGAYTFYRAVRTLPPGHSLTVDARAERIERWWRPEDAPAVPAGPDGEYAAAFLELYERAVRDRLRGVRLPGAHLSGGLDSSSVAVLAAREQRRAGGALHAFCWHPPPGDALGEAEAAPYGRIEAVCAQEGLSPVYHAPSVEHAVAMLRRDGARFSARDDTLTHETLVQRSAVRLGVDVLLSGYGGDEGVSFNGRGYYAGLLRQGRLGELIRAVRRETNHPVKHLAIHAVLPQIHSKAPRMARRLARGHLTLMGKTFEHPGLTRRARRLYRPPRTPGVRPMQLELILSGRLASRIEDWAASGARRGVEYRYPLLDRRLLEFALGLPPEQFRRGRWNRWLMRHALRGVLPPVVRWNPGKAEPRPQGTDERIVAVLNTARRALLARGGPLARARYLDMPSVIAHLEAAGPGLPPQVGKLYAALRFLDW